MNADCRYSLLTIVNAFLQLAKATRLVGFSVMQFTIDLNVKKMHQPELKCCKHVSGHRRKVQCRFKELCLHVGNLCGRPTNVEHRCEKAVAHGPHKV